MPNIKSAKKRVLVSQTKAMQNKAAKSALKTDIKKFEAAVAEGNRSEADVAYKVAVKAVDKAAAKGLLHKNNAANKKSSMTIKLNKPSASQAAFCVFLDPFPLVLSRPSAMLGVLI